MRLETIAAAASTHVCHNCLDSDGGCDFCEPLNYQEADEVSQEDLEAAADYFDKLFPHC